MDVINVTKARAELYRLIDETAKSHEPVIISGKRNNAVLVSEDDWKAIQETLYLLSIPGMRESIIEGLETPFEECAEDLSWPSGK
jgi:prevent-host-death family protein